MTEPATVETAEPRLEGATPEARGEGRGERRGRRGRRRGRRGGGAGSGGGGQRELAVTSDMPAESFSAADGGAEPSPRSDEPSPPHERQPVERVASAPSGEPRTIAHFEPTIPPEPSRGGKPYVVWSSAPAPAESASSDSADD
jgi:ribonuclease E